MFFRLISLIQDYFVLSLKPFYIPPKNPPHIFNFWSKKKQSKLGTRPRTLRLFKDPSHRSLILAILHSRQPTLWLHDLCLEVLTEHGKELRLFGAKAFPLLVLSTGVSDIAAVGTTINVCDGVWAEKGASRPSFKPRSAIWKSIEFEFLFSSGVCRHA